MIVTMETECTAGSLTVRFIHAYWTLTVYKLSRKKTKKKEDI